MTMKVRRSSELRGIKAAFGNCADGQSGGLRYLHKGTIVDDSDTAESVRPSPPTLVVVALEVTDSRQLGLRNYDIIQVLAESKFGGSCSMSRKEDFASDSLELLSVVDASNSVLLRIEDMTGYVHR